MIHFINHSRSSAIESIAELVELYSSVYSEPPYSEGQAQFSRFRDSFREEVGRDGFSLISANSEGRIVGAAYGWTMAAGAWWSSADRLPSRAIYEAGKFAVMEWMVHPSSRKGGIGRELLRRLLEDRPEGYATLASDPRSEARAIYARSGWREVAKSRLPWGAEMDLLVVDLSARVRAGERWPGGPLHDPPPKSPAEEA